MTPPLAEDEVGSSGGATRKLEKPETPTQDTVGEPFWHGLKSETGRIALAGMEIRSASPAGQLVQEPIAKRPGPEAGTAATDRDLTMVSLPSRPGVFADSPARDAYQPLAPAPQPGTLPPTSTASPRTVPPATPTDAVTADPRRPAMTAAQEHLPSAPDRRLVEAVARELRQDAARERERRGEWP